ncbi:Synaptophysin [Geodia barretti]|uniref:Synaptophysin n=1 Tax=Geodia barretti TaxID=519541 RepID=A0AA35RP66_GEOBA|nr:Synaptophysin [Geodia barretti]
MMAVKWEYQVGPLTLNFRVLLEPKGFLRILMVIISILTFSITAGFTNVPNNNSLSCTTSDNVSREVSLEFNYPFRAQNFKAVYIPFDEFIANVSRNESSCQQTSGFDTRSFAGFAQYFVAMGVLSFLYCLGILFVYILFINPQLSFAKWIILFDFVASFLFAFLYLLADILWSAGISGMDTYVETELRRRGDNCLRCPGSMNTDSGLFAQPAISVVFGWLLCFVWLSSIWFVYKDTHWHKDRAGPLSENYSPNEGGANTEGPGPTPAPAPIKVADTTY